MPKPRAVDIIEIGRADLGPMKQLANVAIKLRLGGARRGYVFTMTKSAYEAKTPDLRIREAQALGNLVHPHPCALIIMPDEAPDLRAYQIVAK